MAETLDDFRWRVRPLLVFAPSIDERDTMLLARFASSEDAFSARDMVLVTVLPDSAFYSYRTRASAPSKDLSEGGDALRERFGVAPADFAVILVGLDGTEKARWSEPVDPAEVFALIDAMPMRRREMREGGE